MTSARAESDRPAPSAAGGRMEALFSALKAPDEEGNVLSDDEQIANSVLLVTAGFETTMSLISNAVRTLLLHPEQLVLLRADPMLAPAAVDEVLRFEPPALWTSRFVTEDVEVQGVVIPAGANVLYVFVIDPSVKGADYTVSNILAEAFPAEVQCGYSRMPR